MSTARQQPIVAIATAAGRGGVGIVRISGSGIAAFASALCGRVLRPREATYAVFRDADGHAIDQGIALCFAAPHSFTGEDVLELQAHGGPVVLQLLVRRCLQLAEQNDDTGQPLLRGLRLARAGEFSERAFLNGKMDLAQAEAIADLIDAASEAAARGAMRSLEGAFSAEIENLRGQLVTLRTLVEATLDFPDEEIDFLQQADAQARLDALRAALTLALERTRQGALLREGLRVAIVGPPNAGKSSLLNALAGAELAIVTPIAGTTRDVISGALQIEGVPLHVVDTAGLREASDEVERLGIERAWSEIERADVVLYVHDLDAPPAAGTASDDATAQRVVRLAERAAVLHVWNKADLHPRRVDAIPVDGLAISAKTGEGLPLLRSRLLDLAGWQPASEGAYIARTRHVEALRRAELHLMAAQTHLLSHNPALELLAEELRLAQQELGAIVGAFTADDLLGAIFGSFCIGK